MFKEIISYYNVEPSKEMVECLQSVEITPEDYRIHLLRLAQKYYALVDCDYAFPAEIPNDIEKALSLKAIGWISLVTSEDQKLVEPHSFSSDRVVDSAQDWKLYHQLFLQNKGRTYAMLLIGHKQPS